MQPFNGTQKKPPMRATIPAEEKLLVSRGEAAQLLSISQWGLDYLIANRKLPTRRIGGRVLVPVPHEIKDWLISLGRSAGTLNRYKPRASFGRLATITHKNIIYFLVARLVALLYR